MSQLTNATSGTINVGQGSKITLQTAGTYIPTDIELTMNITTASPVFDGGEVSGGSQASFDNITTSSTDNGIKIQTKYLVNRAAVLYNGAVNGWVSKDDNASALAATNNSSYTNGTAYYITALTVPKNKDFSLTTTSNTSSDSSSITVTNGTNRSLSVLNNGSVMVAADSNSAGSLQVAAYASASDTSIPSTQTVVTNGVWHTTSVDAGTSAKGPYYGKTNVTAISQTNLTAANIKYGTTVTVKGGTTNIYNITGTFTSDGDITAADVATGKIAYSQGQKITGEMPSNGTLTGTISTQNGTYTIPAGHTSGGTITATFPETSVSTPTWTKNSSTKIINITAINVQLTATWNFGNYHCT